ncbi:MAG: ABC transporter permease [Blautia marasmi]
MIKLLWAERQKLRRSNIVWITIFAAVMAAVIVFAGGLDVYEGPDVQYGLKAVHDGVRLIDNPAWYKDEVQPWATFLFCRRSLLFWAVI